MITFPVLFINLLSIIMMGLVIAAAWMVRTKRAAKEFFIASCFMLIWSIGSFAEMISSTFTAKLFWRNFTQIGVFLAPVASLVFSLAYTGFFSRHFKLIRRLVYLFQSLGVLLVCTDWLHHLIRVSVHMVKTDLYETVVVETTIFGKILVSFNFLFMLVAFFIMLFATITASKSTRNQIIAILLGMVIPIIYSLLKVISDEKILGLIPISGVFALSGFFMLLGIHRYDLFRLTPLAHQQVFQFLGEGIVISSNDAQVIDANPAAKTLLGESYAQIAENLKNHVPQWHRVALEGREATFETRIDKRFLKATLYPITNNRSDLVGSVTLFKDITKEKQQMELLRIRAEVDGLTGLLNRQTFIEQVERQLAKSTEEVHLIYFDLDHFKLLNDVHGHRSGDAALKMLGTLVHTLFDHRCLSGRMGGEEFAVFSTVFTREEILKKAEALREAVQNYPFTYGGTLLKITISVGVVTTRKPSFDDIYLLADNLLYQAKQEGRNCVRSN